MLPDLSSGKIPIHDGYEAAARLRAWLRLSDEGGADYAKGKTADGDDVLWEYPAEKQNPGSYARRQSMAIDPGLVGQTADDYLALSEVRDPVRPEPAGPGPYVQLLDDADAAGTPLSVIMHELGRQALVEGESWLWVDSTAGDLTSDAERQRRGERGLIRRVSPDSVVWWKEQHGRVVAVAVLTSLPDGNPALYLADEESHQVAVLDPKDERKIIGVGSISQHSFGGCPLVRMRPFEKPFAKPLSAHQREVFNYGALKREEVFQHVFSLLVATGVSEEDLSPSGDQSRKPVITIGASFCVILEAAGATLTRLPPTDASDRIQSAEQSALERYFMLARLSPGNPLESAQPESGVARKVRFHQQTAILRTLTRNQQAAENNAVWMWSQIAGTPYPGDALYPRDFDLVDETVEVSRASSVLTMRLPTVLHQAEVQRLANRLFSLTPEQRKELDDQVAAMGTEDPFSNNNPGWMAGT